MRTKEERGGVIPLLNLPILPPPPPHPLLLAFSPATTVYVDSKEKNNGAESEALRICEFYLSYF